MYQDRRTCFLRSDRAASFLRFLLSSALSREWLTADANRVPDVDCRARAIDFINYSYITIRRQKHVEEVLAVEFVILARLDGDSTVEQFERAAATRSRPNRRIVKNGGADPIKSLAMPRPRRDRKGSIEI
jgi:hypothetical protein